MPLNASSHTLTAAQDWRPQQYQWMSIIAPFVLFFALIITVELTAKQQRLHEQNLMQGNLTDKANDVRSLFEYELNSTLHLATGLASYIQSKQGALAPEEIDPWLTNLQKHSKHIRNIGIAPNNRISYIYPLAGNEAALGLYYPENKEQWPAVQMIIANRVPILAGPIHLQQGGLGLIYRIPVFLNNENYWGLISTVLNFDSMYGSIHARAQQLGIKVAIKDSDRNGHIIFGDSDVIANTELNVSAPGRNWKIVASQNDLQLPSSSNNIRAAGWLVTLAISLLFNSFLRSIGQQNKILRELNESKYRFSQAFNSAPQGILLITHKGAIIDTNESLCNTLGYDRNELQLHNFFTLIASHQRERFKYIIAHSHSKHSDNDTAKKNHGETKNTNSHQYETTLLHNNGQPINVCIGLAPTHTNSYESDWIVQIINISHRMAFEQLLKDEACYNQSILHAVADAIITLDASGNIRSINQAASRIFGYSETQFIHQHINHFVQDPESGSIMRHIKYHRDGSDINADINHTVIGLNISGEAFPIDLQLSCIHRKQEKLFIAVIRNLSEHKSMGQLKLATPKH